MTKAPETLCPVRESTVCNLRGRPAPRRIDIESFYHCNPEDYIGYFADESGYDNLIQEDCDVYVGGMKMIAFRKSLFPKLKEGAAGDPETWNYLRWAARFCPTDQRGLAAGRVLTQDVDSRLTCGQENFFRKTRMGKVMTLEEALEMVRSSPDYSLVPMRISAVKEKYPEIDEKQAPLEKELFKRSISDERRAEIKEQRGVILRSWFEPWLIDVWSKAEDKVACATETEKELVTAQFRANKVFSNILGSFDRAARLPYGRLAATAAKKYEEFVSHKDIYQTACSALKETLNTPDNPRWDKLYEKFSKVKDPNYNLFGTCFTTVTLNWNFRTAYHLDGNNCEGGIAVLTAMTKGEYEGHYLVFPEIRCAFDLRDGDFLAGDNQSMIHGNTAMIKKTPDAERVSLVFYSRERMTRLDDLECENCRKDFLAYAAVHHTEHCKSRKGNWGGVWINMWKSQEWMDYKKKNGMERCTNTNHWGREI